MDYNVDMIDLRYCIDLIYFDSMLIWVGEYGKSSNPQIFLRIKVDERTNHTTNYSNYQNQTFNYYI